MSRKGIRDNEFKIVPSILVKVFIFELPDGPETVIELGRGILPRSIVAGASEQGMAVPLRLRRFEQDHDAVRRPTSPRRTRPDVDSASMIRVHFLSCANRKDMGHVLRLGVSC
ncbi:hypothetical protein OG21DRAFT_814976 [Imleria badia]|nr:hypothetical protein OG21DRAFT_814976 [Imleria badia]